MESDLCNLCDNLQDKELKPYCKRCGIAVLRGLWVGAIIGAGAASAFLLVAYLVVRLS